jgi:hypothetical protein
MFKKADIFVAVLFVLILTSVIVMLFMPKGESAVVYLNGQKIATLSLSIDTEYNISRDGVEMRIVVSDGFVNIEESNCPDHLCESGRISKKGEKLVCLPNRVVVEISGESEVDAVT